MIRPPLPAQAAYARPRRRSNPESRIVTAILKALAYVKGLRAWRVNSGRVRTQSGGLVALAPAGTADILGVLAPTGRLLALEVKQPGKRPTPIQDRWAAEVRKLGGFYAVVTSVDEALEAVDRARGGAE